jgi:hypothetical protein
MNEDMVIPALKVTSHIGRDLLQSAQLFRHEHSVVWEYVANGLQYKDPATRPNVVVNIDAKAKKIQVRDNGRGMSMQDLHRYFQMHGENLDRKQGKPGRGYFGTGKSAAFGIANLLRITTVRDGLRSKVQLSREDIESHPDGESIPITIFESEIITSAENGTLIEIEEVFLKKLDINSIRQHIERHIAHWPHATVILNKCECEFIEPDINTEYRFNTEGTEFEALLGKTELVIRVAKAPLEETLRGVDILSEGVWYETTLAGCDRKPFAEYLFGEFEVPLLANDKSKVPAFDMSRSMRLNPRNEMVAGILQFVGVKLEAIRKELERQDRERRRSEEQKRLEQQGSKIAELINNHFKEWRTKLRNTMAKAGKGKDLLSAEERATADDPSVVFGDELPGNIIGPEMGGDPPEPSPPEPPPPEPKDFIVELDETAEEKLAKKAKGDPKKISASGGFNVAFEKIGKNEKRAKYDRETRTIFINLEHPRVAVEIKELNLKSPGDDPNFMKMAYEIACTEYAIVLAQELSSIQYYVDPQDALVDVRQALDDLSRAFTAVADAP